MKKCFCLLACLLMLACLCLPLQARAATLTITKPTQWEVYDWTDSMKLTWNSVSGAAGYYVSIRNITTDELMLQNEYTTSTSMSIGSYLPEMYCKLKLWVGAVESSSHSATQTIAQNEIYIYISSTPEVTVGAALEVGSSSAVLHMSVDKDYGYDLTDSGFYVGTSSTTSRMTQYSFHDYSTSYGATTKGDKYMTITGLEPDTLYYYKAYAVNLLGETITSKESFTTTGGPLADPVVVSPENTRSYDGYQSIKFDWNSVTGAEGYRYYVKRLSGIPDRDDNNEPAEKEWKGSKSTSSTYYTLSSSNFIPGYWYKFVVEAYADGRESGWSEWVYCYADEVELEDPVITSPDAWDEATEGSSILLDWDKVTGAEGYRCHIKQLAGEPDTSNNNELAVESWKIDRGTTSSYTLSSSNVHGGYWYKFVVEAYSATQPSSWSDWIYVYVNEKGTLDRPVITSPTADVGYEAGDRILFTWSKVANAANYTYYVKQLSGEPNSSSSEAAVQSWQGTTGASNRHFTLEGENVKADTWYKFVVEAKARGYDSGWSKYTYIYIPKQENWVHYVFNGAMTDIFSEAFADNTRLRTFDASSSQLESIGSRAFANCTNLQSINLPASVEYMAEDAFANCPQLTLHCVNGSYAHQYALAKHMSVQVYGLAVQTDMIQLSQEEWNVASSDAASAAIRVSSSGSWTALSDQSWVTLGSSSGTDGANVVINASRNTTKAARYASVTFTCGQATAVLRVSQNASSQTQCTLNTKVDYWEPTSGQLTREIVVQSDSGFDVSSNQTWLTYSVSNATITARVTSSSLSSARTGVLTITCRDCGAARTVTVSTKGTVVPAPSGLTVTQTEPLAVHLSWKPVSGATYVVERSADGGAWTQISPAITSGTAQITAVDSSGVSQRSTYRYRVYASKNAARSAASAEVSATTPALQTLSFLGTIGSIGDEGRAMLAELTSVSWSTLKDATYKISLKDLTSNATVGGMNQLSVGTASSRSLSGLLTAGHQYRVWVGAFNAAGRKIGQTGERVFTAYDPASAPAPTITVGSASVKINNSGKKYFSISFTATNANSIAFDFGGLQVYEKWDRESNESRYGLKNRWEFFGSDIGNAYSYESTSWTASFYPPAGTALRTYPVTVTAIGEGGTKSASTSLIVLDDSAAREQARAHADRVYNYTWTATEPVMLHYNDNSGVTENADGTLTFEGKPLVAQGSVRGIPYTLSSNSPGGGSETPYATYLNKDMADRTIVSHVYKYWDSTYKVYRYRVGPKYGMSCATYVSDCIRKGFPNNNLSHKTTTGSIYNSWGNHYITPGRKGILGDYQRLQKGDYLYKGSHVMLIGENDGTYLTIYEQNPCNDSNNGRQTCSKRKDVTVSITLSNGKTQQINALQVCMQCAGCQEATIGTRKRTQVRIDSTEIQNYQPMFVNYFNAK